MVSKSYNWLYIVLAVLAVLVVADYWRKRKERMWLKFMSEAKDAKVGKLSTTTYTDDRFPLKKGSSGANVRLLQTYLNDRYKAKLTIDGKFGDKTEAALKNNGYPVTISEAEFEKIKIKDQTAWNRVENIVTAQYRIPFWGELVMLKSLIGI